MKLNNKIILLTILALLVVFATGCELTLNPAEAEDGIQASGTVEAVEVVIASEKGGRIAEVWAN